MPAIPVLSVAPAVITALTLMLFAAVNVSLFLVQVTGALTLMSPRSLPFAVALVVMLTLLVPRLVCKVVAPIPLVVCAAVPDEIVKFVGSSNHVPLRPKLALVSTTVPSATFKWAPLVSICPPLPPRLPPLAVMLPLTRVTLSGLLRSAIRLMLPPLPTLLGAASAWMLPLWLIWSLACRRMVPPLSTRPLASRLPLLLMTPPCKRWRPVPRG